MTYPITANTRDLLITALEDAAHSLRWEIENAHDRGVPAHAAILERRAGACDAALQALDANTIIHFPTGGNAA